jgi:hypothetical protein
LFRRYLLGELDETEQEALEKDLLTGDEHFQELLIAEDELVDDYCAGTLSASEEQEYRRHFLITPERREQHRFGAALRKHLSATAAPEVVAPPADPERINFAGRWRLPLAAAAAAALLATGVWWILQTQHSPFRLEESVEGVQGSTVAFFLTTGGLRSTEPETKQTITVPAGVGLVELQLDLPTDRAGDHEVTLEDARSGAILAEGTLPARTLEGQWVVVASVPADLLASGDYRVVLRAPSAGGEGEVLGTYAFRVTGR